MGAAEDAVRARLAEQKRAIEARSARDLNEARRFFDKMNSLAVQIVRELDRLGWPNSTILKVSDSYRPKTPSREIACFKVAIHEEIYWVGSDGRVYMFYSDENLSITGYFLLNEKTHDAFLERLGRALDKFQTALHTLRSQ